MTRWTWLKINSGIETWGIALLALFIRLDSRNKLLPVDRSSIESLLPLTLFTYGSSTFVRNGGILDCMTTCMDLITSIPRVRRSRCLTLNDVYFSSLLPFSTFDSKSRLNEDCSPVWPVIIRRIHLNLIGRWACIVSSVYLFSQWLTCDDLKR